MSVRPMIVAGVMSGTSADGIDVALVRIADGKPHPRLKLIAHDAYAYPKTLRSAVLAAMNASVTSAAELAQLNWRLGIAYADALKATLRKHSVKLQLVGCHGQTLYHQAAFAEYKGKRFACTWQAGEAAVIASELRVPVVSNFRPADMLAGGQGAPLVSLLDLVLFADRKRGRVLQNIGGIANLTAIPAGGPPHAVVAFDTGPGNMVIDALALELFNRPFDRGGAIAARGKVIDPVLAASLRNPYFRLAPPRTTGREQFGREFVAQFLSECRRVSQKPEDALATATVFTAQSIAQSYRKFVHTKMSRHPVDYIVSGGGARNRTLMAILAQRLAPFNCQLATSEDFGMPTAAKEAAAFALLAWQTWHRRPGNVPAATGATRPAILGQVIYA